MRNDDEDAEEITFAEPGDGAEETAVEAKASKLPLIAVLVAAAALVVAVLGWMAAGKAAATEDALRAEIAALRAQLENLPDPTEGLVNRLSDVDRRFETVGTELVRLNQLDRQLRTTREEVQRALDGVTRDVSRNRTGINELGTRMEALTEGLNELRTRRTTAPVAERGESRTPLPEGEGTLYRIQSGDTLLVIARRFGVTLQQLMEANPTVNPNRLQIGQEIVIPVAAP